MQKGFRGKDNITIIAVDTANNLEQLIKTNRTIIAGVQFNHEGENVSKKFPINTASKAFKSTSTASHQI